MIKESGNYHESNKVIAIKKLSQYSFFVLLQP